MVLQIQICGHRPFGVNNFLDDCTTTEMAVGIKKLINIYYTNYSIHLQKNWI